MQHKPPALLLHDYYLWNKLSSQESSPQHTKLSYIYLCLLTVWWCSIISFRVCRQVYIPWNSHSSSILFQLIRPRVRVLNSTPRFIKSSRHIIWYKFMCLLEMTFEPPGLPILLYVQASSYLSTENKQCSQSTLLSQLWSADSPFPVLCRSLALCS